MTSIADASVKIPTTSESNFSNPSWFGEVVVISRSLQKHGILSKINEYVRFARKRCGQDEVIDFLAVLFGYAISGERTDGGSSTSDFSRLPLHSWPCLSGIGCPLVQRSPACWPRSPRLPSKRCARSFSMICSPAHSPPTRKPEGWWIGRETAGACSTSTAREKLPGNARLPGPTTSLPPFVGWMTSVPQAIGAASAGKW